MWDLTHEGSNITDSILVDDIVWADTTPDQEAFNGLMDAAITAIDHWISERM